MLIWKISQKVFLPYPDFCLPHDEVLWTRKPFESRRSRPQELMKERKRKTDQVAKKLKMGFVPNGLSTPLQISELGLYQRAEWMELEPLHTLVSEEGIPEPTVPAPGARCCSQPLIHKYKLWCFSCVQQGVQKRLNNLHTPECAHGPLRLETGVQFYFYV